MACVRCVYIKKKQIPGNFNFIRSHENKINEKSPFKKAQLKPARYVNSKPLFRFGYRILRECVCRVDDNITYSIYVCSSYIREQQSCAISLHVDMIKLA